MNDRALRCSALAADRIRDESGCVIRYDRTFMRPLSQLDDRDGSGRV